MVASLVAISWISLSGLRENADSFLIIAGIAVIIIYPLFFIPPVILFYFINKKFSSGKFILFPLLTLPFLWTGFEYLSSLGQINFPWLFAGNTQTYNLVKIQFAEYTGVFGVSFWICLISVFIYFLINKINLREWKIVSIRSFAVFFVIMLLYFAPDFFNLFNDVDKFLNEKNLPNSKIKLGIVQPNVNPWNKWSGKQNDIIADYIAQIKEIHSANSDVQMIILPETALPYYYRERYFEERYTLLKNLCDSLNVPLLIGTPDLRYYDDEASAPVDAKFMKSTGRKYDTYNSAVLFEPKNEREIFQKHDKIKLVPGSERVPYQEIFPFTKSLIEWGVGLGSWQIGRDTNLFQLKNNIKFNTAICYESVYPEFFSEFVNKGADFSVIITNDGWWGKFFGTYQHNRFAVFRAIENRRWIARCANTGISDFIDPEGKMYDQTEINEKANIIRTIPTVTEKTFFTKNGDLFSKVCLVLGLIIFGVSFFIKKKN